MLMSMLIWWKQERAKHVPVCGDDINALLEDRCEGLGQGDVILHVKDEMILATISLVPFVVLQLSRQVLLPLLSCPRVAWIRLVIEIWGVLNKECASLFRIRRSLRMIPEGRKEVHLHEVLALVEA